jgi:cysteinyl-tRNA synthetase
MLKLTNTLTGKLEEFEPGDGKTVRMYICGPTVHDFVHIGNFRTFVSGDVLRRHLKSKGWGLEEVMNITDVDDKIIRRAIAEGVDIRSFTDKFTQAFLADSEQLGIQRPEIIARATDHIPDMVALVETLLAKGFAYREGDSVYFRISQFPEYGRLSRLDKKELKSGARVEVDEYDKESPQDFVLWKAPKDAAEPRWDTGVGVGRPGWHLECSAMAMKYLGQNIDLHCGGVDLIFPHHENEIAQSEAATGKTFARFWIHCGFLQVEGEKMAKSRGNFYLLRDLLEKGFDPLAIRYLLVSVPYRKQFNFTFDGLHQADQSLARIREFRFRLGTARLEPGTNGVVADALRTAQEHFEEALDDDLNTAVALAAIFNLIKSVNTALDRNEVRVDDRSAIENWLQVVDDRLGVMPTTDQSTQAPSLGKANGREVESLIEARNDARARRDFARADEIRRQLGDMGVLIEDTREGTRWRYR